MSTSITNIYTNDKIAENSVTTNSENTNSGSTNSDGISISLDLGFFWITYLSYKLVDLYFRKKN